LGSARSASRSSSWRSSRRWAGSPEVRDGGEARGKENGGESLEDLRKELAEEGVGELDRLRAEIREKHLSGDLANPAGPSKGSEPETLEGGGDLDKFREEVKANHPEKVGGGAEECNESRVGEEISAPASDSALADRPQLAEPRDAMAVEVPETVAVRPTHEDLDGPDASEALMDAADVPRGRAVVEAASTPADRKDKARSDPSTPPEPENDKHEAIADREQRRDKVEAAEPLATFSAAAVKQATDGMTRFEVDKSAFEERSGMKLDKEKVYAFEGDISGVGSFRKIYDGNSEGDRLAFFAPKEKSDSIPAGEGHEVRIDFVREVSSTKESLGTFFATAYMVSGREGREDSVRLDIPKATFEKRTGFHFEDRKTYEAKGKVDGVHEFKLTHTGSRENQHVVISFFGEEARKIEVGKEHTVTVESIEEKRTLTVSGEGNTTRLTLQKRALESLGIDVDSMKNAREQDRLVELTVRNLSSDDRSEKTVYGRVQPREGAMPLSIGNIGGRPGDTYELVRAREHMVRNFVEEFNMRAGGVTRNVRLSLEGEKAFLEVDGRKFEAKYHQLGVHHLQTFLSLEIEPFKQDIRLWIEGNRVTANFAQSSRLMNEGAEPEPIAWWIKSFATSERGLEVTFVMGSRTITTRSGRESLGEKMSMKEISERIEVVRGDRLEGSHSVHIQEDLVSHLSDRILRTKVAKSSYFFERGGLGEDLGAAIVSKIGLDEIERHPFDSIGPGSDPKKGGTDALHRDRKTGKLVLVEFRWWQNHEMAMEQGLARVKGRQRRETIHPRYGEISGAYVTVLKLDLGSNRGELHVRRAW